MPRAEASLSCTLEAAIWWQANVSGRQRGLARPPCAGRDAVLPVRSFFSHFFFDSPSESTRSGSTSHKLYNCIGSKDKSLPHQRVAENVKRVRKIEKIKKASWRRKVSIFPVRSEEYARGSGDQRRRCASWGRDSKAAPGMPCPRNTTTAYRTMRDVAGSPDCAAT